MSMKKIKCPLCDDNFTSIDGLYDHIEEEHGDSIPQDFSTPQFVYYLKTDKTSGTCVVCKKPTKWNPATNKYHRFCENPKCKEKYKAEFQKRMIKKYGKVSLLKDPEHQRKMLANRKISGTYKWSDGKEKTYTGSYELDFLKFLDLFMNFESEDIMTPSPHTYEYIYEGESHFYIPDLFIPSLNLEIEIKESDNNHPHMKVDREKERLKDEVLNSQKTFDYIKIVDKKYDGFMNYLMKRKEDFIEQKNIGIGSNITMESSYSDLYDGSKNLIEARKHIRLPKKIDKNQSIILAEDIIDNINKISPELLDTERLRIIRDSDDIIHEATKYMQEKFKEYRSLIDSKHRLTDIQFYNASMVALTHYYMDINSDDDVYDIIRGSFIPNNLSDDEIYKWIDTRISENIELKDILSKIFLKNVELFMLSSLDAENEIMNDDSKKIKILKNEVDMDLDIIKRDGDTLIFDFSKYIKKHESKMYINEKIYNTPMFNSILKPSRYLARAYKYDTIILTHGINDNNDNWSILEIRIDNKSYTDMYELLDALSKMGSKKILLMACNMNNIDVTKWKKYRHIDIEFGFDDGYTSSEIIYENNLAYKNTNNIMDYWEDITFNTLKSYKEYKRRFFKLLSDNIPPIYPDYIQYIEIRDNENKPIFVKTEKCDSLNDYIRTWEYVFDKIFRIFDKMYLTEMIACKHYRRYFDKYSLNEHSYTWVVGDALKLLSDPPGQDVTKLRYNSIEECLSDLYIFDNILRDIPMYNSNVGIGRWYSIHESNDSISYITQKTKNTCLYKLYLINCQYNSYVIL